jgi:outer membrane protein TolC
MVSEDLHMAGQFFRKASTGLLICAITASVEAQTLAELEQRLLEHPAVTSLSFQAEQYREASTVAGSVPDPVVSLGFNNVPIRDPSFDQFLPTNKALGIRQAIPNGGKRRAQSEAATESAEKVHALRAARLAQLRGELLALLHDRQRIERQQQLMAEQLERYQALATAIEAEINAGRAVVYRLAEIEAERAQVSRRQLDLTRQQQQNAAQLIALVGDTPALAPPLLSPRIWSGDVLEFHPVAVAAAQVNVEDSLVDAAEADWGPDWGVQLTYQQREDGISFAGDDWVSGQVSFTLPLWSSERQKPALRQAEAARSQAVMAQQLAAREAVARFHSEQAVWQSAQKSLDVLAINRRAIEDEIAAQTANYESGSGNYAAIIDGDITLLKLDAEVAAIEAQREIAIARMNALMVTS